MVDVLDAIMNRKSSREWFDPGHPVAKKDLDQILEAARWSPTAHNMQNFEILVVDDSDLLEKMGNIRSPVSAVFIKENYEQLSFSEEELKEKKTGILGTQFPPSWTAPGLDAEKVASESGPSFLMSTIKGSPIVLVVIYDTWKRAPASDGDVLGLFSLGCVMENMWLAAEALGLGYQVMSAFSSEANESQIKELLRIPDRMSIAFAIRLGYPASIPPKYFRVRRDLGSFVHLNGY